MKKIAIIGGGISGCLTAIHYSNLGYNVEIFEKDNFQELEASIQISKNSKILTIISPSKRYYHVSKIITTEAGIYRNWFQDFYLVIGSEKDGKWGVKMYLNPMVNLIWIGVMLMIYSGLLGIRRK